MSDSPLIQIIVERLLQADYSNIQTPFKVASVVFDFTAAFRGKNGRALDLVLLVDTTTGDFGDRDAMRVRQRIEALSRALDVTGSRLVVTVILAGAILASDMQSLSETCRVLHVHNPLQNTGDNSEEEAIRQMLDNQIGILLPLILPIFGDDTSGEDMSTFEVMTKALPSDLDENMLSTVLAASDLGSQEVSDSMSKVLGDVLEYGEEK